ncbi:unnamed protein product [Moneuplotes crassus]|uniref:Uncharacterized protein n=1 Tax=Euplotes crassus TaxID=5936 RepID=A0AAD1UJR7_EUPCR|nr:unnamed protein product [Moneuplotes crassus]
MERKKDIDHKISRVSNKLGLLFVKELLSKKYKINYYQKIKAKSGAFHTWKAVYQEQKKKELKKSKSSKSNKLQMYINKHKIMIKSIKNQNAINMQLESEKKQLARQIRICKTQVGLKKLSKAFKKCKMSTVQECFTVLRDNYHQNLFVRNPELNRDSIISDIPPCSELGDSREDQYPIKKMLSKFHEAPSDTDESQEEVSQRDSITSHDRRMIAEFEKNLKSGNIFDNKFDFHQKTPLAIDIPEPEKEDDEAEVIRKSKEDPNKSKKTTEKEMGKETHLKSEDHDNNYYPQVENIRSKLSPFEKFKRNLIINTDSINNGSMKQLQKTEDNSETNKMLKRRQNPPATLTTNATSSKNREPGQQTEDQFDNGIYSQKYREEKSLEEIQDQE